MAGLVVKDKEVLINICQNGTQGEVIEISNLSIQLPKQPAKKDILFYDLPKKNQYWKRSELPRELSQIRSMDEWY